MKRKRPKHVVRLERMVKAMQKATNGQERAAFAVVPRGEATKTLERYCKRHGIVLCELK